MFTVCYAVVLWPAVTLNNQVQRDASPWSDCHVITMSLGDKLHHDATDIHSPFELKILLRFILPRWLRGRCCLQSTVSC